MSRHARRRRAPLAGLLLRVGAALVGLLGLALYAAMRLQRGRYGIVGYERGSVAIKPPGWLGVEDFSFPYPVLVLLAAAAGAALVLLTPAALRAARAAFARRRWTAVLALGLLVYSLLPWGYADLRLYAEPNYWLSLNLVLGSLGFGLLAWGTFPLLRRAGPTLVGLWRRVAGLPPRWFALGAAGFTLVVASVVSLAVFGGIPHITDEIAQLFHARVFALGRLFAPSPALPSFFDFKHVINDGRWYSQYPFGHPLMLALGVLAGLPWLVNPLQAAVAVLALYGLGREIYTERVARIAALLYCLSPFVWFMSGSFMNHTTAMCWGTLFLLFFSRLDRRGIGNALLCGLSLGMVVATRPATAIAIALPAVAWLFLRLRREPQLLGRAAATTGVVAAFGLLLLVQNWLTTGAPLSFGYTVLHGPGHGFVFGPAALGVTHTPYKGFVNVTSNLAGLNRYLFEWPVPALILPLALLVIGPRRAWDRVLLAIPAVLLVIHFFYFFHGFCYGPRFVFEAVPALLLLSARALPRSVAALRCLTRLRTARVRSGLAAVIALAFVTGWVPSLPRLVSEYSVFSGVTTRVLNRVRAAGITNALVFTSDFNSVFAANRPDLKGPVVYARDLGALNPLLAGYFPDREAWLVGDDVYRLPPFGASADTLLRELGEARTWAAAQARFQPGYRTLVWPLDNLPAGAEPGEPPLITLRTLNGLLHRRAAELDSFLPALLIGISTEYGPPFEDLGALQYASSGRHYCVDSIRLTVLAATRAQSCWVYDVRRSDDSTPITAFRPANPAADPLLARLAQDTRRLLPSDVKSVLWPTDHGTERAGATGAARLLTYARLFQGIEAGEWEFADLLPGIAFWVDGSYERHPELTGFMADRENYRVGGYYFTVLAASPDSSVLAYLVQSRVGEALDRVAGTVAAMLQTRYRTVFWPTAHASEPSHLLVEHLAGQFLPYREAYAAAESGRVRFQDYLPAIAFWESRNLDRHPLFMRAMDSGTGYETGDYRFTLLAADPDSIVSAWLIERAR